MADLASYRSRSGRADPRGAAISVTTLRAGAGIEVMLKLGVMRNFGSISADAWAALTPLEARELATDLRRAADKAEAPHG